MTGVDDGVCSEHPCAPHGFNRNQSHSEDRYVCDCEGWRPDRTCVGLELLARAETAEAALLAKSAEYDALVARVEVAPIVAVAIGYPNGYADTDIEIECYPEDFDRIVAINGQRVRLLVSDDRHSHTAGDGNG